MGVLDAVETVLARAGNPLHIEEITRQILEKRLWHTSGKTPEATVGAALAIDIKRHSNASRFQRTNRGVFALRTWGLPEYMTSIENAPIGHAVAHKRNTLRATLVTMKDAAEIVLELYADNKPMTYQDITRKAFELRIIATSSQHAANMLLMQVVTDITRQAQRGLPSRFTKPGKGLIGLSRWVKDEPVS